jgi:hypothetical protein
MLEYHASRIGSRVTRGRGVVTPLIDPLAETSGDQFHRPGVVREAVLPETLNALEIAAKFRRGRRESVELQLRIDARRAVR